MAVHCTDAIIGNADILQGAFKWNNIAWVGPNSSFLIFFKAVSMAGTLVGGIGLVAVGRSHLVAAFSHHVGVVCVIGAEIVNFRCFFAMAGGDRLLCLKMGKGNPPCRAAWNYMLFLMHRLWRRWGKWGDWGW
jgi:hypothetical protein